MKRKRVPSNPSAMVSFKKRTKSAKVDSVNRIPRTLREFPTEMRVKLKYSYCTDFTIASGPQPNYVAFRANSVFDPEAAIGGGTPTGFVQWSSFYSLYTVVGSSAKMRLIDRDTETTATGTYNGLMGIAVKDTSIPIAPWTQSQLITDSDSNYCASSSYTPNQRVIKNFNAGRYFGIKDILDDDALAGQTGSTLGSNPSQQAYFICWANLGTTGSSAAQVTQMEVLLEYDVIFRKPADL